jgi:tRNA(Ile)-lysidine synthase
MHPLEQTIIKQLEKARLQFPPIQKVLLAISGGIDSLVLLDILDKQKSKLPWQFYVGHVNHGLQSMSDQWFNWVQEQAQVRKIPFIGKHLRLFTEGVTQNIEAQARQARYDALTALAKEAGCEMILLAHHADDQIETFLLQWFRGAGLAGLSAIPELKRFNDLLWMRPLLHTFRVEIEDYAKQAQLNWVEDPSNQSLVFARNQVRSWRESQKKQLHLNEGNLLRSISLIGQAHEELKTLRNHVFNALKHQQQLNIDELNRFPTTLRQSALRYWIDQTISAQFPHLKQKSWTDNIWNLIQRSPPQAMTLNQNQLLHFDGKVLSIQEYKKSQPFTFTESERIQLPADIKIKQLPFYYQLTQWPYQLEFTIATDSIGIPLSHISNHTLEVKARQGGEKLKLHPNRPQKTLKQIWQETHFPVSKRLQTPIVYLDQFLLCTALTDMNLNHPILKDKVIIDQKQTSQQLQDLLIKIKLIPY